MYFECLVSRRYISGGKVTKKVIRWFSDEAHAFAWLSLEGYKVLSVRQILP